MNTIEFYKYQGTGNDFVMINNLDNSFVKDTDLIAKLCDRRFGVGSDGLILIEKSDDYDFRMVYYNSDGNEGTMCGNGGRCIVAFARDLGVVKGDKTIFIAVDGVHNADILEGKIKLQMQDVSDIIIDNKSIFMDTGSPHHIEFVNDVDNLDVDNLGSKIRYGHPYLQEGTNVNFVQIINKNTIKVRTYERGVEAETLSCGTGVTASSIASYISSNVNSSIVNIISKGGELKVYFDKKSDDSFENIYLEGPAKFVFKGTIKF